MKVVNISTASSDEWLIFAAALKSRGHVLLGHNDKSPQ
jgi:hypothetical protein